MGEEPGFKKGRMMMEIDGRTAFPTGVELGLPLREGDGAEHRLGTGTAVDFPRFKF